MAVPCVPGASPLFVHRAPKGPVLLHATLHGEAVPAGGKCLNGVAHHHAILNVSVWAVTVRGTLNRHVQFIQTVGRYNS